MKKLLFVSFLLMAVNSYAQFGFGLGGGGFGMGMRVPLGGGGGRSGAQQGRNIDKEVQHMKKDLNLTDDQTVKVRSLLVERERRRDGSHPMAVGEFNERLDQILTPEQSAMLREKKQQKHQKQQPVLNDSTKQSSPDKKEDWDDVYR